MANVRLEYAVLESGAGAPLLPVATPGLHKGSMLGALAVAFCARSAPALVGSSATNCLTLRGRMHGVAGIGSSAVARSHVGTDSVIHV